MNLSRKDIYSITGIVVFIFTLSQVKHMYIAKQARVVTNNYHNHIIKDTVVQKITKISNVYNKRGSSKPDIIATSSDEKKSLIVGDIKMDLCFDETNKVIPPKPKKEVLVKYPTASSKKYSSKSLKTDVRNVGRVGYRGHLTSKQWKAFTKDQREVYRRRFISRYWSLAHREAKKAGVHDLIILARTARESRWGTSQLCDVENNIACIKYRKPKGYFDVKVFRDAKRSGKYDDDDPDDTFCSWDTKTESIQAFCHFVNQSRYKDHIKGTKGTLKNWAEALCKGGYSTSCSSIHDYEVGEYIVKTAKEMGLKMYYTDYKLK